MMSYHLCATRQYVVLAVNFLNLFLCGGFPFNMSVLNLEFLRVFGDSKAQTALVQAVTTGILDLAGIICGQVINRYGVRIAGMCGGLLIFLGLSLSFFATSIPYLIVSIGVIAGFGFSLTFGSCFTSVGEYFNGRAKLIAISVIGIGAGCGSMVFPYLMAYLIEVYGWRGCVLLVGGLMGNIVCFFAVCKPKSVGVATRNYDDPENLRQPLHEGDVTYDVQLPHQPQDHRNQTDQSLHEINIKSTTNKHYTGIKKLKLLCKNIIFIIFIFGISLKISSFISSLIYMLEFLQTKGFDEKEALLLYFYMNVSTTIGRLLPGLCILIPGIDGLIVSAIFTSISCVSGVGLVLASEYYQHVILMCTFGMVMGCGNTVLSMTTMEIVGLNNYAVGLGVLMTVIGVSSIIAGVVSGWLVDVTGSYHASYYSLAAAHGLAVVLFTFGAVLRKCHRKTDS
ncbi:monocarboxylate transporter 9-like [Argopecten irradians]|uniref:monocarboxylate transporter 9-like n=1 Tax=Argopecten irradians TaxID=31199 RepID=UPI00371E7195